MAPSGCQREFIDCTDIVHTNCTEVLWRSAASRLVQLLSHRGFDSMFCMALWTATRAKGRSLSHGSRLRAHDRGRLLRHDADRNLCGPSAAAETLSLERPLEPGLRTSIVSGYRPGEEGGESRPGTQLPALARGHPVRTCCSPTRRPRSWRRCCAGSRRSRRPAARISMPSCSCRTRRRCAGYRTP